MGWPRHALGHRRVEPIVEQQGSSVVRPRGRPQEGLPARGPPAPHAVAPGASCGWHQGHDSSLQAQVGRQARDGRRNERADPDSRAVSRRVQEGEFMSTLAERLAASVGLLGGAAKEWPAYVILRELLPARLRALAAAVMSQELEGDTGFAESLLSCADSEPAAGSFLVDDLVLYPPAPERSGDRELVRSWLRGRDSDHFSMLA